MAAGEEPLELDRVLAFSVYIPRLAALGSRWS